MGKIILTYILIIVSLVLVQVLVCNHIMLFGIAIPIVFFYPLLRLPMSMSAKWVLTIAFILGFIVDIFSDTPGVNTISCTVLAALRKPVLHLFIGNDDTLAGVSPAISTLGFWTYFKYALLLTPAYCLLAVGLEYFTFVSIQRTLSIIGTSSLLSFILVLGIDALTGGKARN